MKITYHYDSELLDKPDWRDRHERALQLLHDLSASGKLAEFTAHEHRVAFQTAGDRQQLMTTLRDFSLRHHVGLAHVFGSQRRSFWYLPPQFILVFDEGGLSEVFPCRIGREEVDVLVFLSKAAKGEPWTIRAVASKAGTPHKSLVSQLVRNPDKIEKGLRLEGTNIQVSRDFGELGYIDLVFRDAQGRYLLMELKVKPEELDKAIGQIARHRHLFATQNRIDKANIRAGIASRFIPFQYRAICRELGIEYFELASA